MHDWNVIMKAGSGHQRTCLNALKSKGRSQRYGFKGFFPGHVLIVEQFLEKAKQAQENQEAWMLDVSQILPLENIF
jgi:hypothetical protein